MKISEAFLIYKSFWGAIENLPDTDLGKLFRAIFEYQISEKEPDNTSEIYMPFMFFKNQFRLDKLKYDAISELNKINGSKGGKAKVANAKKSSERKRKLANLADNENDNDNVNEKENDIELKSVTVVPVVKPKKDFIDILIDAFCQLYLQERGQKYALITPKKDRAGMGKILHAFKKEFPDLNGDQMEELLRGYFLQCLQIKDKFQILKTHIALKNLPYFRSY